MVTPRENLLRVFRHEMPRWIPIVGHVDTYNQPSREGMDPELADAFGQMLLELYRRTKMDAVHAFTVPPTGNVTIGEGRRGLGSKITIIAGVKQLEGSMEDRDAVKASVRTMFEEGAQGDHLIFNLTAYPDKTMEETRFVLEECRKYQRI